MFKFLKRFLSRVRDGLTRPLTTAIAIQTSLQQSQHDIVMQRPICVFPEVPRYNGTGDSKLPENFKCVSTHAPDYNNQKPAPIYGP